MATVTTSLPHIASLIDHSLLHPTLTDADVAAGLTLARTLDVAAACVKPCHVIQARNALAGSPVRVCAVVGFPHGSSTTSTKLFEAKEAMQTGAHEVDVVVNVGKVRSGDWEYVRAEIDTINRAVTSMPVDGGRGADGRQRTGAVKVIFENDFLTPDEVARLAALCGELGVAWVKTSTGFGFVKQAVGGGYTYRGATGRDLKLMKENCGPATKIKAAGGIRTLDQFLYAVSLGVERVGATATEAILEEARRRGITEQLAEFPVVIPLEEEGGEY